MPSSFARALVTSSSSIMAKHGPAVTASRNVRAEILSIVFMIFLSCLGASVAHSRGGSPLLLLLVVLLILNKRAGQFVALSLLQRLEELPHLLFASRIADHELLPIGCSEDRVTEPCLFKRGFASRHRFDLFG